MKKSILTTFAIAVLLLTFNACGNTTSTSSNVEVKSAQKAEYTCTMHPEVRSDKPGNCPKCGMKLVLMDTSDTTHMHNLSDTAHMMK